MRQLINFYPRPADSIGHSVRPSLRPSKMSKKKLNSNFSALGLDRDLGFSRGPPPGSPRRSQVVATPPPRAHCAKTKIQISQHWDLIETWGFRVDLPLDPPHDPRWWWTPPTTESTLCKNKKSNFSALELDRDLGFSRGPPAGYSR